MQTPVSADPRFLGRADLELRYGAAALGLYVLLGALAGGGFLVSGFFLHQGAADPLIATGMILFGGAILAGLWLDYVRTRLEVRGDRVRYRNLWGEKSLSLPEIQGFRVLPKGGFVLVARPESGKGNLRISTRLGDFERFRAWAGAKLPDLTAGEAESEDALALRALGGDQARYALVKNVVGGAYFAGFALFVASILVPRSNAAALALGVAPWAVLLLAFLARGVVRVDGAQKGGAPKCGPALMMVAIAAGMHAVTSFRLLDYRAPLQLAPLVAAALLGALWLVIAPELRPKRPTLLMLAAVSLFYGYGVAVEANCRLDRSAPEHFTSRVIGKRVSHGKHTTYYLRIEPWGPVPGATDVPVGYSEFASAADGDAMDLWLRRGALGARWYTFAKAR